MKELTFLGKSHGECNNAEKPAIVPISYEWSNDEKLKQFQAIMKITIKVII